MQVLFSHKQNEATSQDLAEDSVLREVVYSLSQPIHYIKNHNKCLRFECRYSFTATQHAYHKQDSSFEGRALALSCRVTPSLYPLLTYLSRLINDIFVNSTLIRCLVFIQVQLHSKNFINFGCDNKKKLVSLKNHFIINKFCAAFRLMPIINFICVGIQVGVNSTCRVKT